MYCNIHEWRSSTHNLQLYDCTKAAAGHGWRIEKLITSLGSRQYNAVVEFWPQASELTGLDGQEPRRCRAVQCHHPCLCGTTACRLCRYKTNTSQSLNLPPLQLVHQLLPLVSFGRIFNVVQIDFADRMSSINLPRLSTRMQSNAISYGAHQLASGQRAVRRPTIGAPEIMLTTQPTANLKRRSHIRRTSRSGNSPTTPPGNESSSPSGSRPNRPQPLPLTTAFTRSITTSVSSGSVLTRQPTVIEYSAVEWRDSPQYQPKVTSKTDVSRK
jgi:hypothetical protein